MDVTIPKFGRSVGIKLLFVCALVLLMGIPALFISLISHERAGRAQDVMNDVSARYGGAQTILGQVLVIPYSLIDRNGDLSSSGEYIVFAEDGKIDVPNLKTTVRKRSLYKVPTYEADMTLTARFEMPNTTPDKTVLNAGGASQVVWGNAKILVGISDVRGLRDDVYLTLPDGSKRKFSPALDHASPEQAVSAVKREFIRHRGLMDISPLQFMQVDVADLVNAGGDITFSTKLALAGSSNLSIIPFAKSTKAELIADWPHPSFIGHYAPSQREISSDGFSASWSVPFLARGIAGSGPSQTLNLGTFVSREMSVNLITPVTPYQNVNRALKYAILFIGIVFLVYFLFETLVDVRVHAAQYVLVGLVQCVFYLLLLAFAEHVGFTVAFIIAACATIAVTTLYAGAVFGSSYRLRAGAVFAATYGLLYVLMRMEDFALMVGALTSFLAIAGTMYLTRNVNWYGGKTSS